MFYSSFYLDAMLVVLEMLERGRQKADSSKTGIKIAEFTNLQYLENSVYLLWLALTACNQRSAKTIT